MDGIKRSQGSSGGKQWSERAVSWVIQQGGNNSVQLFITSGVESQNELPFQSTDLCQWSLATLALVDTAVLDRVTDD